MKKMVHDVSTGVIEMVDLTPEEVAELELSHKKHLQEAAEAEAKEAARQALLDKLGITADEAKLLLG